MQFFFYMNKFKLTEQKGQSSRNCFILKRLTTAWCVKIMYAPSESSIMGKVVSIAECNI